MAYVPKWATKPKHTKKVIATEKGWVVEETGEILYIHKNLIHAIEEFKLEIDNVIKSGTLDENLIVTDEKELPTPTPTVDTENIATDNSEATDAVVEHKEDPKPKKRGPKTKNKKK